MASLSASDVCAATPLVKMKIEMIERIKPGFIYLPRMTKSVIAKI